MYWLPALYKGLFFSAGTGSLATALLLQSLQCAISFNVRSMVLSILIIYEAVRNTN